MRSLSARCGHVKRRLAQDEPLKGELLEFALSLVEGDGNLTDNDLFSSIARKLEAGEPLDDYEKHFMIDVVLLHVRLGAA